jgi:hypothetical protein
MQDFPKAEELLDALAAYLFTELRPLVPKEERFRVLVAANVCAVVAREIRAGEGPSREDATLFSAWLGTEGEGADGVDAREAAVELSAGIRAGEFDDELPALIEQLQTHVRRKLDIARPGYAD